MQYLTLPLFHYLLLWLYSVLRASKPSALPSSTPTSAPPESKSNKVPLAVGLTFGLLTLAIAVLAAFSLHRRRRRKSALLGATQESKRRPQSLRSSLSSG